jgi:AraC-like DNA-binding protein
MSAPESRVPYELFDTTPELRARRYRVWREAIDVVFDVRPAEPDAAESPILLHNWLLGPAVLVTGGGGGFCYHRTPRAIARDGRDMLMVQFYQQGECRFVEVAPEAVARPGDLVVTDMAHPVRTQETAFLNINLFVPRPLLANMLRVPDTGGSRVFRGDDPLVGLARAHLQEVSRTVPRLPAAAANDVLSASLQLVAAAMNGAVNDQTVPGVRAELGVQMRRHIAAHLDDTISPEDLAVRFGVSRATVYRLFAVDGGVRRYMRRRRLLDARLALVDPGRRHLSVGLIGDRVGYAHPQDFVRAYRREFGLSPGAEREQARTEARSRPQTAPTSWQWVDWLRQLG